MGNPAKLPEIRKEAFSKARESLGLTTKDLSGMACLSVRQIEQLENGESSAFYGPQVKVTAAKKVAALLKLKAEDAFDSGDATPPKPVEIEISAVEAKPVQATGATLVEKNAQPSVTKVPEKAKETTFFSTSSSSKQNNPKKKLFVLLGIAAALTFPIVNLRPIFFPEPVKEELVIIEEPAPVNPPAEPVAETKPEEKTAPTTFAAAPAAVATPVTSSECPPVDAAGVSYKTDAPKKAGDMVFLQSKTAQTVCVVDASGKTQNKILEPGVGVSIFGKPPLKVLTSGQAQVDMYYQGVKVRLSNTTAKTIILEPAEIVQPAVPTDSQLR
ncbi:hypothetical protein A8O14_07035 [Polynucleobacter wuianus]|uniref:HTH cro/C1-type domain-containing protein n=1 Tax=Polynucleobacter wuianus TaxID=1743168 RepID=A0A191UFP7_9BURK|nr:MULTISPECIES: helix-turn-helix transcriptional regulator [Polynucleobacter]ANI99844.1 hypothetical protein A8O14_07035 [Polynucleobacter wuianus]MBU3552665.1 helix-turn-helix transcriptional regulator [Polynucleobacter sp. MWH-Post4-6-1]